MIIYRVNKIILFLLVISLNNISTQPTDNMAAAEVPVQIRNFRIIDYTLTKNNLKLSAFYGQDKQKVFLCFSFPYQDALRVQIRQKEDASAEVKGKPFEFHKENDSYLLKTDSLILQIQKEPWRMKLTRKDGSEVFNQRGKESGYYSSSKGITGIRISAGLHEDEGFFGFGEKFNGMNQRGRKVEMKIYDAYVEKGERAYKSIPFFISSARYGLLVNTGLPVVFHLGDQNEKYYSIDCPDKEMDYYIFANRNPLEIIRQYTDITGKSRFIPKWALEPWLSRRSMTGWNNTGTVEADIDLYLRSGFPLGVILWEGIRGQFNKKQSPDLHSLSDKWHALGIKQIFWSLTGHLQEKGQLPKDARREYFIRNSDSSFAIGGFKGGHIYLDPTNPEAMEWWERTQYVPYISDENGYSAPEHANLDGVKLDFCELFPKYTPPLLMNKQVKGIENLHSVLFSEQIYDWLQKVKPDGGITWVRGGGLGIQRVGYVWGGDRRRNFQQFGATVSASLSLAVCGVALSGYDLGGYIGGNSPDAREVYIRAAQYSAFSPSFHDHGSAPAPWEQDEYGIENYKFYARLRYNLIPYLYQFVRIAHEDGFPIIRPLFLHYPQDKKTYEIEDEYLLGDDLLAAPFVQSGTTRPVYLPRGEWIDFWTGELLSGSKEINYTAPLNRIPVFVKNPAIIPLELNEGLQLGGYFSVEAKNDLLLTFAVYGSGNNHLQFYDSRDTIDVAVQTSGNDKTIKIKNIDRSFAVLIFGNKPDEIEVDGRKTAYLKMKDFALNTNGWTYDSEKMRIMFKTTGYNRKKNYTITIKGVNQNDFQHRLKERLARSITPPDTPHLTKAEQWQSTTDIYFSKTDNAFGYVVNYGFSPDSLNKRLENIYESPAAVRDLPPHKVLYVTVSALNERGVSKPSSQFKAEKVDYRNALFSLPDSGGFLRANYFNFRDVSDDWIKRFDYTVSAADSGSYHLWIKAKKNITHHQYFRWYYWGELKLQKGVNRIELIVENPRTELGVFYLTKGKNDRPIMKKVVEMKYSAGKTKPFGEIISIKF